MLSLSYGSRTHVGKVRKNNQDSLTVVTGDRLGGRADGLFIVADGMGGHAGGEIASRIAV
jgi:protein phosphatase